MIEEADSVCEKATETTSERGGNEEIADTKGKLFFGVKQSEINGKAWKKSALNCPKEQATRDKRAVRIAETGQGSDDAPRGGDEGDPTRWAQFLDYEVGGESSCERVGENGGIRKWSSN